MTIHELEIEGRDLTDPGQNRRVLQFADLALHDPTIDIDAEVNGLFADPVRVAATSPVMLEGFRAAQGRHLLDALDGPVHLTVVWAMYGETGRIARREEHPHGEDFLRVKVAQLRWLFTDVARRGFTWSIVACDDGCPDTPSSADRMDEIIAEEGWGDAVRVVRLADAIGAADTAIPGIAALASTSDSRKGGAILHAAAEALRSPVPEGSAHVVLLTDADLSANLAQAGGLVADVVTGAAIAAGQRYGVPGAALVKPDGATTEPESTYGKPDKVIVLFRHWVRTVLIPSLAHVLDTQAGFKAISADALAAVLPSMRSVDESFDVELLIRAAVTGDVVVHPILFTEDLAATNFPSVDPGRRHLDMVRQIVDIAERFGTVELGGDGEPARLAAALRNTALDRYVALIEWMRAADDGDPQLFERRWSVDEIVARLA